MSGGDRQGNSQSFYAKRVHSFLEGTRIAWRTHAASLTAVRDSSTRARGVRRADRADSKWLALRAAGESRF